MNPPTLWVPPPQPLPLPFTYAPPPQTPAPYPHHPPPSPDLPTALSTLTSLLNLCRTTFSSLPAPLPSPSPCSSSLSLCPYNPNHLLPASSLFLHSLSCTSSPSPLLNPTSLLSSLQYPHTLQHPNTPFTDNPTTDLCLSLDNYLNVNNPNFFYQDCPAVVFPANQQESPSSRFLILPSILSLHCADYRGINHTAINTNELLFNIRSVKLLPSEQYAIRKECTLWNDYPLSYSSRVLKAIICLQSSRLECLPKWVVENSPKYGVLIDLAMCDHLVVLFKLCLSAISSEAIGSANALFSEEGKQEEGLGMGDNNFDCPVLVKVMMWLASQLSVLYGDINGKSFAIQMLKQCVVDSSMENLVFPIVEKDAGSSESKIADDRRVEGMVENCVESNSCKDVESIGSIKIYVSQVAAAAAAVHERSILEDKIKTLRDLHRRTPYQRMVEHACISQIAVEERQKRPNYRPVIEHDGLLWRQSRNQETHRMKTREELLAEERDYKRRRMSYRGKKLKRSTTEVMRDIIDEYMEEIKQAGGVDGLGAEEENVNTAKVSAVDGNYRSIVKLGNNLSVSSDISNEPHDFRKSHSRKTHPVESDDERLQDKKRHRRDRHGYIKTGRSFEKRRHGREDYSRSPEKRRSSGHSRDSMSYRQKRHCPEDSKEHFSENSERSHRSSHRQNNFRTGTSHKLEPKHKGERNTYDHHRSGSVKHNEFEDRYDPSESHGIYEDDV